MKGSVDANSEQLSDRIRIGASGYSYPGPPPKGWNGIFYPARRTRGFDELAYYASLFNTVEINTTFYRPPPPGMAEAWARRTPADFEFAIKTWQKFTHPTKVGEGAGERGERWGSPTNADVESFKRVVDALADAGKLGVMLFQYPPGLHFTQENVDRLAWALKVFHPYPKAVELRHRSWSDRSQETRALLGESDATWAVIDEPKFDSSVQQSFEPMGEIFYLRLHGRNRAKWWSHQEAWERYDYLYGPEEIRFFADRIREITQQAPQTKIYVFFNNHARGQAVANGLMLKKELGQAIAAGVPKALLESYPQLAEIARIEDRE